MNNLPTELEYKIFEYAFGCKSEQNFYINKDITMVLIKKFDKCKCVKRGDELLCYKCDIFKIFVNYISQKFDTVKSTIVSFTNMILYSNT